jgi:omega-6 fatty acid desaturase (delta-12 desaturase)
MNAALALLIGAYGWAFGFLSYLTIIVPLVVFAGAIGIWLFYVQHQFEGVYWARHDSWNPLQAALNGSSFYRLPAVVRWFTGNIGLHHIHHVQPRIPNYHLRECYKSVPEFNEATSLSIGQSLRSVRIGLFDEKNHRSVSFRFYRRALSSP